MKWRRKGMTSQRSLRDNIKANDFKRSLRSCAVFPFVASLTVFVVMTVPVLNFVITGEAKLRGYTPYTMFVAPGSVLSNPFELLTIIMLVFGMITSIKHFYFLLIKKQVNLYLSRGVSRKTMYFNRVWASLLCMFVAVLVPMFIEFLTNAICFGFSAHLVKLFLYATLTLFVSEFIGFAITTFAIMVSGNVFEVALTSALTALIPTCIFEIFNNLCAAYLKGFVKLNTYVFWVYAAAPWGIATNMKTVIDVHFATPSEILGVLDCSGVGYENFVVPEKYEVGMNLFFLVILWFVVAVLMLGLGYLLFNRRKAEYSNTFGSFKVSRIIVGTVAVMGASIVLIKTVAHITDMVLFFFIWLIVAVVIYFAVQLMFMKKIKYAAKSISWVGVLSPVIIVMLLVVASEWFGTFNVVPEMDQIQSVSIDIPFSEKVNYSINKGGWYEWEIIESKSDESKEMVMSLFKLLQEEEKENFQDQPITTVSLVYRDSRGVLNHRKFNIYREETYEKYKETVVNSSFFDEVLDAQLVNEDLSLFNKANVNYIIQE